MAQYRKSFYGSSLYGKTTAFTSEYLSAIHDAGEPFDGQIRVGITASTPTMNYLPGEPEVTGGTSRMSVGDKASFLGSTGDIEVVFQGKASGTFRLKTYVIGESGSMEQETTKDVSMVGAGEMKELVSLPTYEERLVEIEVLTGEMDLLHFSATVTDYSIEVGTSSSLETPMTWEVVPVRGTGVKEAYSSAKTDVRYVRFRITLASSDDKVTPVVDRVELLSGDAGVRSETGSWKGSFNMEAIAQQAGKTFAKLLQVDWTDTRPDGTSVAMRSRSASSAGSTNYGAETAQYRRGYRRIRLPRNTTEGFVYTRNPIDIRQMLGQNNTNRQWRDIWDIKSLPTNVLGQNIRYEFYDRPPTGTTRPIAIIEGNDLSRATVPAVLNGANGGKVFYLGIRLKKGLSEQTPVVDWVAFDADIQYKERKGYTGNVSAVDNVDGRKALRTMSPSDFGWPTNANGNARNTTQLQNQRSIRIYDRTGNAGIRLFFLSKENEKDGLSSTDLSDQVWAHAKAVEPQGQVGEVDPSPLYIHYHYNGGSVQYPHTDSNQLGSDFTPSLSSARRYRYHIVNGWPDREERLERAMTWAEAAEMLGTDEQSLREQNPGKLEYEGRLLVGQWLKEPNLSVNERAEVLFGDGEYTEKSIHNGGENAVVEGRLVSGAYGVTPWSSEEKVYEGYINLNDIRGRYRRTQRDVFLNREEVSHIVINGDTYPKLATSYGVDVEELARLNENRLLVEGDVIRVPSRLALPRLAPEVLFLDEEGMWMENPYKVSIIPNSVRQKGGKGCLMRPCSWRRMASRSLEARHQASVSY